MATDTEVGILQTHTTTLIDSINGYENAAENS